MILHYLPAPQLHSLSFPHPCFLIIISDRAHLNTPLTPNPEFRLQRQGRQDKDFASGNRWGWTRSSLRTNNFFKTHTVHYVSLHCWEGKDLKSVFIINCFKCDTKLTRLPGNNKQQHNTQSSQSLFPLFPLSVWCESDVRHHIVEN